MTKDLLPKAFPEIMLCVLIASAFVLGGGSRPDIASLMILRPITWTVLGLGLITISMDQISECRWLFLWFGAVSLLALLHLVPLPPAIWQSLAGRDIIVAIDGAAGLQEAWRPLTMDPVLGRNALWSLAVPLAALVWVAQSTKENYRFLIACFLAAGCLSALMGLLQIVGPARGIFYTYDVTNYGMAVGLFANRNHHAVFLASLLPCLAGWLSMTRLLKPGANENRRHEFVAIIVAAFLVLMTLATGSRAGFLALLIGIGLALWIYVPVLFRQNRTASYKVKSSRSKAQSLGGKLTAAFGVGLLAILVLAAINADRALSLDRILAQDLEDETRSQLNQMVFDLTYLYLPFGSGIGSFENVFKLHEPDAFLNPAYANHAHNDILEVAMTAGIPGIILMAVAAIALALCGGRFVFTSLDSKPSDLILQKVGVSVLVLLAMASFVDYPLRVPSIQIFAVLAAVFMLVQRPSPRCNRKRPTA